MNLALSQKACPWIHGIDCAPPSIRDKSEYIAFIMHKYRVVQKDRDSQIWLYLQYRADWMQNLHIQTKTHHFLIEIAYCLSNIAMQIGFLPYLKNKIQTPLRHTAFFIQIYLRA